MNLQEVLCALDISEASELAKYRCYGRGYDDQREAACDEIYRYDVNTSENLGGD